MYFVNQHYSEGLSFSVLCAFVKHEVSERKETTQINLKPVCVCAPKTHGSSGVCPRDLFFRGSHYLTITKCWRVFVCMQAYLKILIIQEKLCLSNFKNTEADTWALNKNKSTLSDISFNSTL